MLFNFKQSHTIRPVASVGNMKHGCSIKRVLHNTGKIKNFGSEFRSASAILSVRLGYYRNLKQENK